MATIGKLQFASSSFTFTTVVGLLVPNLKNFPFQFLPYYWKISLVDQHCSEHEASGLNSGKYAIASGKVVTFALHCSLILFA